MKKMIFLVLMIILAVFVGAEETILQFDFWVNLDNTIAIENVKTIVGSGFDQEYVNYEDYFLEVGGYKTYFPVMFRVMTNPPRNMDKVLVRKKLPYNGNTEVVRIYKQDDLLFSFSLSGLCNQDSVCNGYENSLSCASDCDLSIADSVCVKKEDGVCDPDCYEGVDDDCGGEVVEKVDGGGQEPTVKRPYYLFALFGGILVIVALVVVFVRKKVYR